MRAVPSVAGASSVIGGASDPVAAHCRLRWWGQASTRCCGTWHERHSVSALQSAGGRQAYCGAQLASLHREYSVPVSVDADAG